MDAELLARARAEGLNLSAALEEKIRSDVDRIEIERWKRENAGAIESYERRITDEGVAGEEYRRYG
jgi:post-segregation antitoxin (ccd killing protein)